MITCELKRKIPSDIDSFLEERYKSIMTTSIFVKEIRKGSPYALYLYEDDKLKEVLLFEREGSRCVLLNCLTDIPHDTLDYFCQYIFREFPGIKQIRFRLLKSPFNRRNANCYVSITDLCIDLPQTTEEYEAGLGTKSRQRYRSYYRKLKKDFENIVFYENALLSEINRESIFDDFVNLKENRQEQKKRSNSFDKNKATAHRKIAEQYGRFTLAINEGNLVGGLLCYKVCDEYFAYVISFDIQYYKYSVARVLFWLSIKKAIEEGASKYHFLWGGSDYVTHYGGGNFDLYNVHVFRCRDIHWLLDKLQIRLTMAMHDFRHSRFAKQLKSTWINIVHLCEVHMYSGSKRQLSGNETRQTQSGSSV